MKPLLKISAAAMFAQTLVLSAQAHGAENADYKVVQRHIDAMASTPMNSFVLRLAIGKSLDLGPLDGSEPPAPTSASSYLKYAKALPTVAGEFSDAICGVVPGGDHEVECTVQFTQADGKKLEQTQRYTVAGGHITKILTSMIRPIAEKSAPRVPAASRAQAPIASRPRRSP